MNSVNGLEEAISSLSVEDRPSRQGSHSHSESTRSDDASDEGYLHVSTASNELEADFYSLSLKKDSDDTRLVKALYQFQDQPIPEKRKKNSRHLLRATSHKVMDPVTGTTHQVDSWKMAEWEYKKDPCPFPTRARGLFTEKMSDGQYRIIARGYNKFFNIGEVEWTRWNSLSERTKAPYYLTVKSNGCIILIAALSPKSILVTSKHSIGELHDRKQSHAQRGEEWLEKHLASIGKTKDHLAAFLWDHKLTAVAELCDDDFEEHVLGYSKATTGLHLHGLNYNAAHLLTFPPDEVAAFAREWGLIETAYEVFQTIDEVKRFTDGCSETGMWRGEHTEGFVVRASSTSDTTLAHLGEKEQRLRAFMWKVKFDEPYMMWREWREKTKAMLSNKKKGSRHSSPTASLKGRKGKGVGQDIYGINVERIDRLETRLYVRWCAKMIDEHPEWFDTYTEGRGMIAVRDHFVEWLKTQDGQKALESKHWQWQSSAGSDNGSAVPSAQSNASTAHFDKTLLVPIAIPGCGKTTMALALTELFGWGHTQSDNVSGKKPGPRFLANVKALLQDDQYSIVIADKNNHSKRHREELAHVARQLAPQMTIRIVALIWDIHERPREEVLQMCCQRISDRGERHQSLRPNDTPIYPVLKQFLAQYDNFEPEADESGDGHFHAKIVIPIDRTPVEMLDELIERLFEAEVPAAECAVPTREARDRALDLAMTYEPLLRKEDKSRSSKRKRLSATNGHRSSSPSGESIRYFAVAVACDLADYLADVGPLPGPLSKLPHLTIVHIAELAHRRVIWESAGDNVGESVEVRLGPRMAIIQDRVASLEARYEPAHLVEGVNGLQMHLTVALGPGVKAVEGKRVIEAMRSGEKQLDDRDIQILHVEVGNFSGVIKGFVA